MTTSELKKVMRILKTVYSEMEKEAIAEGVDITSVEYEKLVDEARSAVLAKMGITLEEYRAFKETIAPATKAEIVALMDEVNSNLKVIKELHIPTKEEITAIADDIVKKNLKPPQITNQIVKETIVEKPTIVKETKIEQITNNIPYDEKPLQEKLNSLSKSIDELNIPIPVNTDSLKSELMFDFGKMFEKNIDILGMPNFRKLAMGLRQDLDALQAQVNVGGSGTGFTKETPGGLVNSSNVTFTVTHQPNYVVSDGITYFDGAGYTYGALSITMSIPPSNYIRSYY